MIIDQEHPDTPVTHVYLTGSEVNDDTLRMLSPFRELQLLSLFNTNATGEGLKHLTECKQLKQLTLMGNAVNDQGVAAIKLFPTLTHLSIGNQTRVNNSRPPSHAPLAAFPATLRATAWRLRGGWSVRKTRSQPASQRIGFGSIISARAWCVPRRISVAAVNGRRIRNCSIGWRPSWFV